jgi:hypothetical protein
MRFHYSTVCCLVFISLATACNSSEVKDLKSLNGRWELTYGERNEQVAESLAGIFFEFSADSIITNFTPTTEVQSSKFKRSDSLIVQQSVQPISYIVRNQTDSNLILKTELLGSEFMLTLHKVGTFSAVVE